MSETGPADHALLRLLQLTSPALPIGSFAYSQGLEYAASAGWVTDVASASRWLRGLLEHGVSGLDVPLLALSHAAFSAGHEPRAVHYAKLLLAARGTAELQLEERQIGRSLARCLVALGIESAGAWLSNDAATLVSLFALASVHWQIPVRAACLGYASAWAQNQVSALLRLLPIGQLAGQQLLAELLSATPAAVDRGMALESEDDIGFLPPAQALASSLHETQYSRLFRS